MKTDVIQFFVLITGGIAVLWVAINALGGWSELYQQTEDKMHLHLPYDHETLPWTHLFGLFFLNINYWCANQTVIQRSLAAKNLREAQTGLLVGGVLKYGMAVMIIIPGIALYGILGDTLSEPDMTFPYLVTTYIPVGVKGIILCGLFASLMSTVDSTFNSIATLWSIDIYDTYLNTNATDFQKIQAGRRALIVSFFTALLMGWVLLYLKFENPSAAFTHTLNELRYYINCGIVVLICAAALILIPNRKRVLWAFALTLPLNLFIQNTLPDMNYFVRAFWVIFIGLGIALSGSWGALQKPKSLFIAYSPRERRNGFALGASLLLLHFIFH